jgi:uncharacterized protein YceH (UPF0502 family)
MSSELVTPRDGPWPALDAEERRVLGVLVEKAKTTPDAYPLSLNALVTGSNQKSNRDPLLNLSEDDVEEALQRCQGKELVMKITGGRVVRWRHLLYEAWHVDKVDLAVLAELLLRGPQTEGELRTRANRMEPIDDLDALRNVLKPLVARNLVVYLTAEDRRGAVLTHGFHEPHELARLRAQLAAQPAPAPAAAPAAAPAEFAAPPVAARADARIPALEAALAEERGELGDVRAGLAEARAELAALKQLLTELRGSLTAVQEELRSLKQALGA